MRCAIYMAVWALVSFPMGRLFKGMGLRWDRPPFAEWRWEMGGAVYDRLGIRRWMNLVPDVSRMFPGIVPRKAIYGKPRARDVRSMLEETCVAELIHLVLCVSGLALLFLWPGAGGLCVFILYVVIGNLPFMMIQRYNRPGLRRLLEGALRRERRLADAGSDTVEQ